MIGRDVVATKYAAPAPRICLPATPRGDAARHHAGVGALAAKLVLAPTFIVATSLVARRYGARVGGLVGGLPVVAGPILLVFALDHGRAFGAKAAGTTLLGTVSLMMFILLYTHLASRVTWTANLPAGWGAFLATTAALSVLSVDAAVSLAIALAAVVLTLAAMPKPSARPTCVIELPFWDLPLRAASALALVLVLTTLAGQLGPGLSGLLAPFPIVASVLAAFTHAQHGTQELLRIMRGFLTGLAAYALFCFTLAETLGPLTIAEAFLLASAVAVATQSIALTLAWHKREPHTAEQLRWTQITSDPTTDQAAGAAESA